LSDGRDAGARMAEIVGEMVAARTAEPRGDWLSMVVARGHDAENPLDEREVHGAILALLGGHHSTVRVTSSFMAHLVSHDELQEELRAHPERIPAAVEEAVRLFIPLGWFARTATVDVQLGEVTVASGERVMILYAGTNLDPAWYDPPEVFDTGRSRPVAHLGFGRGIHRCVGMPLAQLELRVAVEELLAASPWVRLREPSTWTSSSEPRHIPARSAADGQRKPSPGRFRRRQLLPARLSCVIL
jgi:cytochrome P450